MKKLICICIILSVLFSAAGIYMLSNSSYENIVDMDSDFESNLYCLTEYNYATILSKTDKEDTLKSCVRLPSTINKSDITYRCMAVSDKQLFILYEYQTAESRALTIALYDMELNYIKDIYSRSVTSVESITASLDYSVFDESVILATIEDYRNIRITEIGLVNYDVSERKYTLDRDIETENIVDTTYGIFFTDRSRSLYIIDDNGRCNKLEADITAYSLGSRFNVIYFDIHSSSLCSVEPEALGGSTYEVDYSDPELNTIVDGEEYIAEDTRLYDVDHVYFFGNLSYGGVISDTESGHDRIITFGLESNTEYTLRCMTTVQCILTSLVFFAFDFILLMLVGIVIIKLLGRRKLVTKQILIVVICLLITIIPSYMLINTICSEFINKGTIAFLNKYVSSIDNALNKDTYTTAGIDKDVIKRMQQFEQFDRDYDSSLFSDTIFAIGFQYKLINEMYCEVAYLQDEKYYYAYSDNINANVKYFTSPEAYKELESLEEKGYFAAHEHVENKDWLSVTIPVYNSAGIINGFIQVGIESSYLDRTVTIFSMILTVVTGGIVLLLAGIFLIVLKKLLNPLASIKNAVNEMASGRLDEVTIIKSNDELQDIAYSFNRMSVKLNQYFQSINTVSQTYEKYIPKDFFKLLGKDSILDVSAGDKKKIRINYLFVKLTHNLNSDNEEEDYSRLGSIYSIVSECITELDGGIYSYDDNRIMCLFTDGLELSIETAINIREKINSAISEKGCVGITVQSAQSYLGVIGSSGNMKCVVVSKAVTLQNLIDRILQKYNLGVVITDNVYDCFTQREKYVIRKAGRIHELLVLSEAEENYGEYLLYEIIDGEEAEQNKLKEITLNDFNEAYCLYESGDMVAARGYFVNVLRLNRNDAVARNYLDRIEESINGGK